MEKKGEQRLVSPNRLGYTPENTPARLNSVYLPCLPPLISNPTSTSKKHCGLAAPIGWRDRDSASDGLMVIISSGQASSRQDAEDRTLFQCLPTPDR